jgi:hypothetical protein
MNDSHNEQASPAANDGVASEQDAHSEAKVEVKHTKLHARTKHIIL